MVNRNRMQLGVMNSKELQPLFDFTQKTYNNRTRMRTAEFQEAARDLDAGVAARCSRVGFPEGAARPRHAYDITNF